MKGLKLVRVVLLSATSLTGIAGTQASAQSAVQADQPTTSQSASADVQSNTASAEGAPADIVVTGVRGAQQTAINVKRDAGQIVDSIAAEDIGKLPDVTIADSLQRVTGVQITRSAGEGAGVNIRGLANVLTTLNGEQFLGASNITGAQPNLTDVPSTLFAGVDVIKSPTAADLSGGNSGIVALKTRRPFDLPKGMTLTGAVQNTYGDSVKAWSNGASALASYRGDRFGFLVAGSFDEAVLGNKHPSVTNGILKTTDAQAGFDARKNGTLTNSRDPAVGDYFYNPVALEFDNGRTNRQRIGGNASAQYQVTDSLQLVGDLAYTRIRNRNSGNTAVLHNNFSNNTYLPDSIIDANGVPQFADLNLYRFQMHTLNQYTQGNSLNTNLEARFDNGGRFTATARWVHATAHSTTNESDVDAWGTRYQLIPLAPGGCVGTTVPTSTCVYGNPGSIPNVLASVDFRGEYPVVKFGTDVTNPANYSLTSTWSYGSNQRATLDAYRADTKYQTDLGFLKSIRVGGRYGTRDVTNGAFRYLSPEGPNGDLFYYKDVAVNGSGGYSVVPIRKFADLPAGYVALASGYGPVTGIPAIPAVSPRALDDTVAYNAALFPGTKPYVDPTQSYEVRQRKISAYAQADLDGGVFGVPFTGNVGVRYVRTLQDIYSFPTNGVFVGRSPGNGVLISTGSSKAQNNSTDWLPDANLNLHVRENMYLRAAFAKTLGQIDLASLGRGLSSSYAVNGTRNPSLPAQLPLFASGSAGNPNLELPRTTNYNLSYEWYFNRSSLLSIAGFWYDVKSFIVNQTNYEAQPDSDGVVRAGGPVSRPQNVAGGTIKGVEVDLQTAFTWLPGILSGFGTQLNYTFSQSNSSAKDSFGNSLPVPDNSKHSANAVLFYQRGGFQGRVAYNWRSSRYNGTIAASSSGAANPNAIRTDNPATVYPNVVDVLAIYSKPVGYLDASLSYDVTPKFTVFAQGTNLTSTNERRYAGFSNFFYDAFIFERRLTFGVRIRN